MQSKLAIMASARKRAFAPATTVNRPGHTIEVSNAVTAAVHKIIKTTYTGVVTIATDGYYPNPIGRNKRAHDVSFALERKFGPNDKRGVGRKSITRMCDADRHDLWGTGDRLIRNGVVVE
jgi:hypothetical protein